MTANIYTAIYSGVPVYEVMCRGIAVMRRRDDSYLNATQILKVAGIEKGKRTKILEREVLPGEHEKVQGGYGKYQGTWVPFQRGKDLAKQYKVEPYLRALFDYDIQQGEVDTITPTKEMAQLAQKTKDGPRTKGSSISPRMSPSSKRARSSSAKPGGSQTFSTASMTPSPLHPSFNASSPSIPPSPQWHIDPPARKRHRMSSPPLFDQDLSHEGPEYDNLGPSHALEDGLDEPLEGAEKYRSILMSIFLNDELDQIPPLLTEPTVPQDLDINLVIDDQGHTALHWAAALARISVLEHIVQKRADIRRVNYNGESALVRAVLVTNNFDRQSFPRLLDLLHPAIPIVDRRNRTLLHHIAIMAGIRGRGTAAHYYMECLLEWIARHGGDFASIIDIQDKNGDTALTIAARVGDQYLTKILMDVGANRDIENKVGLKAEDFGVDDVKPNSGEKPPAARVSSSLSDAEALLAQSGKRGNEIMSVVQKMVDELDVEFSHEIMARHGQIQDTQSLLRHVTGDLTETRRTIKQYRAQVQQLAEAQQKIKNLEQSLEEESQKARNQKGYQNKLRMNDDVDALFHVRPPATTVGSNPAAAEARLKKAEQDRISLRARVLAYEQNERELAKELAEMKGQSSAKELQCKKVIAVCCNIPLEKVDELLVPLTLAVESDGASLDLTRVAGFMSRVKQQDGLTASSGSGSK